MQSNVQESLLLEKIERIHTKFQTSLSNLLSDLIQQQIPSLKNQMEEELRETIKEYTKSTNKIPSKKNEFVDLKNIVDSRKPEKDYSAKKYSFEPSSKLTAPISSYLNESKNTINKSFIPKSNKMMTDLSIRQRCEQLLISSSSSSDSLNDSFDNNKYRMNLEKSNYDKSKNEERSKLEPKNKYESKNSYDIKNNIENRSVFENKNSYGENFEVKNNQESKNNFEKKSSYEGRKYEKSNSLHRPDKIDKYGSFKKNQENISHENKSKFEKIMNEKENNQKYRNDEDVDLDYKRFIDSKKKKNLFRDKRNKDDSFSD